MEVIVDAKLARLLEFNRSSEILFSLSEKLLFKLDPGIIDGD